MTVQNVTPGTEKEVDAMKIGRVGKDQTKGEIARNAKLRPIKLEHFEIPLISQTPMIQHKWSEKAKRMMREKQQGAKKTRTRDIRKPEEEFEAATYRTADGEYGFPVDALKACLIGAAHKDIGIEKTLVRKALFILTDDPDRMIPMMTSPPVMREDVVRVGVGSADLRYRPEFVRWKTHVSVEFDADLLSLDDVMNLFDRAGFGIGLAEMRPEKGGSYGRFKVATVDQFNNFEVD